MTLNESARVVIEKCLAVKPQETVLVITDEPLRQIGMAIWHQAKEAGAEAILVEIVPRRFHGEEPPLAVAELMKQAQAIIIPTSRSLSHTQARRQACQAGARIATMPGITEEIMRRTLSADYQKIKQRADKIASLLTNGATCHITTPAGTDVTMSIVGRSAYSDNGLLHQPGQFSKNLNIECN